MINYTEGRLEPIKVMHNSVQWFKNMSALFGTIAVIATLSLSDIVLATSVLPDTGMSDDKRKSSNSSEKNVTTETAQDHEGNVTTETVAQELQLGSNPETKDGRQAGPTTQQISDKIREARDNVSSNDRVMRKIPVHTSLRPLPASTLTSPSKTATSKYSNRRRMARQEGDLILGALFPVHHLPPLQNVYSRVCGEIREYYGIQRIETFLLTVEGLNKDPEILPNITLGWDIRDSCWYSAIALEQSIDFIRDALASKTVTDGQLVSALPEGEQPSTRGTYPQKNEYTNGDRCNVGLQKPIVGLIGPGSSESTIQVQNLMQMFDIPQIGYSATSIDLSDKNIYKYFLRVVPPDKYQVQALVDIVLAFNWTYISTVHSDGNYGIRGMERFSDLAKSYNICIASTDSVASADADIEFDRVVDTLKKTPNASVVVCFCEGITVQKLLKALKRKGVHGKFIIIGSDGWGNRLDVVQGQEETAAGGISIKLYSPPVPEFDDYYASLKPNSPKSSRNPWFNEFWQEKFKCYLPGDERNKAFTAPCTGNESLSGSPQDSKLGFVASAVKTMALALHNMHRNICGGRPGLCQEMTPINGSLFLAYLLNVSFLSYSGDNVHFDENGDPPGRYEILNYQPVVTPAGNVTYSYVTIGQWMTGELELNVSAIYWPGKDNYKPFRSVCSDPCGVGFVKQGVGSEGITCCWVCTPCKENEIVVDDARCQPCDLGLWPNRNQTDCEEIPVDFISWGNTGSVVVMAMACVGMLITAWVAAIFIRSHDTPVVKASTRELSYILLIGIELAFTCNFLLVAKPAQVFCYLSRILPGLAFSMMYGALVTRTNRIARILEGSKRIMTKKPRFMSATAQVVITGIIIAIECVITTVMLTVEPADSRMDYSVPRRVRLVCNTSSLGIIVPLGFDLFLIFMCTLYAIKTRNLPENFNEAKFIGFTMYTTCVIWLGFFPIYFGGENKEVTMCISISLSAAIALALLFFPKVYVIVWAPEKNTRGAFTTSKDVRCHIGSRSMPSSDSTEFKEGRFDGLCHASLSSKSWKQKSLDEKKLRCVMKRGSMPLQSPASAYTNHGVLANHRAATMPVFDAGESEIPDARRRSPILKKQKRVYIDDFSDYDRLLEDEQRERGGRSIYTSSGKDSKWRDFGCQTGEELIHELFTQLRRRHPHSNDSTGRGTLSPKPPLIRYSHHLKCVTFDTSMFPVNADSPCEVSDARLNEAEAKPLLSESSSYDERYALLSDSTVTGHDSCRRPSNGTRSSPAETIGCPETEVQVRKRSFDTLSGVESSSTAAKSLLQHNLQSSIYHRPPTPRTPHKHIIVNNVNMLSGDPIPTQSMMEYGSSPGCGTPVQTNRTIIASSLASIGHLSTCSADSASSQGSELTDISTTEGRLSTLILEGPSVSDVCDGPSASDVCDDKSVIEFQKYLQERGLRLDMSSVKTSEL